jgi:hypothetical protein
VTVALPPLNTELPCPSRTPPEIPRCDATSNIQPSGAPDAVTVTVTPSVTIDAKAVNCGLELCPVFFPSRGNGWVASHDSVPPAGTTSTLL